MQNLNMQTHETLSSMHSRLSLSNLMQTLMALPYNPMQSFYKKTKYFHLHHVSFMSKTWIAHSHARLSCKPKLDKLKLQTHGKTVACKLKTHHGFHGTFIFHTSLRQTHFHARTHAKIKPQTPCFYTKGIRHLHKTPCKALKNKTIPMHKLKASKAKQTYYANIAMKRQHKTPMQTFMARHYTKR